MRKTALFLALIVMTACSDVSADLLELVSFNPGVKVGYEFGEHAGFILGLESSVTYSMPYAMVVPWGGIVGGIQWNVDQSSILKYWEVEGGWTVFGMAWGGEWENGYHARVRAFAGILGYLSYKKRIGDESDEVSVIGKYPVFIYSHMDHGRYLWGRRIGD